MKKNKISKNWINKQRRDKYVRQSKIDGYRARSVYKLIEIDEKFQIFKGGINVIDLANQYSCSFIATQDLGKIHKDGSFQILGRYDNTDIRGCNLMID